MKQTILLASGLGVGVGTIILVRAFRPVKSVDKVAAEKAKKRNKIIGFSVVGVGLVLLGVAIKLKAFSK